MDDKLFMIMTMMTIITLSIVLLNGFYLYRKSKLDEMRLLTDVDKLEFEKYKFNEMEVNKYSYLTRKLEHEIEMDLKRIELEYAKLNYQEKIDIDKDFTKVIMDYVVMAVDPFITKTYIKNNKPIGECKFGDIMIPSAEEQEEDQIKVYNEIISGIPDDIQRKFDRILKRERWTEVLKKTTSLRFVSIMRDLRRNAMELAQRDNIAMGKAQSSGKMLLFMNNDINPNIQIDDKVKNVLKHYKIKNIKELQNAQKYVASEERAIYGKEELLSININDYAKEGE